MENNIVQKNNMAQKSFAYVALLSSGFHVILVISKYSLGMLSGSIAIKADALHSLIDVLSSLTIYAGIKISERKSKIFPYGLYKVENLASVITSLIIFFAAFEIIKEVFSKEAIGVISNIPIAFVGLMGVIISMFLFSQYEIRLGKKIGSPSLIADAKHIKTDVLSSVGVLIGLVFGMFGLNIDRYVAIILVILISRMGITILIDSLKVLLDVSISKDTLDQITKIFSSFPSVEKVIRLTGRYSGRYKFVEAEVIMNAETFQEAHELSSAIEEEVYDSFPEVDKILIHYEPIITSNEVFHIKEKPVFEHSKESLIRR